MNRAVIKESVRKSLETKARNQELREKAVKACKEINPENPIAAAEAMPLLAQAVEVALVLIEDGAINMAYERLRSEFIKIKARKGA